MSFGNETVGERSQRKIQEASHHRRGYQMRKDLQREKEDRRHRLERGILKGRVGKRTNKLPLTRRLKSVIVLPFFGGGIPIRDPQHFPKARESRMSHLPEVRQDHHREARGHLPEVRHREQEPECGCSCGRREVDLQKVIEAVVKRMTTMHIDTDMFA